ncbi:MAG: HIT domain-containing protein, partial [Chloroflexi bacterium]|nr:HIT domain-containing protein [Chloroflexota bacterium]
MAASEECIFCRIGRGEVPSEKVFDDATAFAIRDINPKAPVHLLLIPYAHVEALADATAEEAAAAAHCFEVAPGVARHAGLAPGGYRLVV